MEIMYFNAEAVEVIFFRLTGQILTTNPLLIGLRKENLRFMNMKLDTDPAYL